MNEHEAWPSLLEHSFLHSRVMNLGLSGFAPEQYRVYETFRRPAASQGAPVRALPRQRQHLAAGRPDAAARYADPGSQLRGLVAEGDLEEPESPIRPYAAAAERARPGKDFERALAAIERARDLAAQARAGRSIYFEVDPHPNRAGYRLIAETVADYLQRHAAELQLDDLLPGALTNGITH